MVWKWWVGGEGSFRFWLHERKNTLFELLRQSASSLKLENHLYGPTCQITMIISHYFHNSTKYLHVFIPSKCRAFIYIFCTFASAMLWITTCINKMRFKSKIYLFKMTKCQIRVGLGWRPLMFWIHRRITVQLDCDLVASVVKMVTM